MIAAAIVRDDFTFVAKAELKPIRCSGPSAGRWTGCSSSAATVLGRWRRCERRRISCCARTCPSSSRPGHPPGPRELGPFKKGPFRMAMATGLPIVPIVIRNASDMAGRGGSAINAADVDVAVLPRFAWMAGRSPTWTSGSSRSATASSTSSTTGRRREIPVSDTGLPDSAPERAADLAGAVASDVGERHTGGALVLAEFHARRGAPRPGLGGRRTCTSRVRCAYSLCRARRARPGSSTGSLTRSATRPRYPG